MIIITFLIILLASTLCAAFIIQQPFLSISIHHTPIYIISSYHDLQSTSYRLRAYNNNDDKDTTTNIIKDELLASHYTSKSILSWLQKMADSYQIEEGEDLLTVLKVVQHSVSKQLVQ